MASCLLSVSKSVTTFKKFVVNEFAGGLLLSRVVSASSERQQPGTSAVADHTAGPTAATLGSIQTAHLDTPGLGTPWALGGRG